MNSVGFIAGGPTVRWSYMEQNYICYGMGHVLFVPS